MTSTSVDVTCAQCGAELGVVDHMDDGWPIFETHRSECLETVIPAGPRWYGRRYEA